MSTNDGENNLPELWAKLLDAVTRASRFTGDYLVNAHPVSFEKGVFTIGFEPEFEDQMGLVDNARNYALLQTKLAALGYPNSHIKFVIAKAPVGWVRLAPLSTQQPTQEATTSPATAATKARHIGESRAPRLSREASSRASSQISDEELGVAAIYSRLQQAMRMTSSVETEMPMREKLTMMALIALARVIGGIRERTTKSGKEGRAFIERVLANIHSPAERQQLNKKARIIECQSCHSLAKLLSAYSRVAYFSAAFWSDGKLWATMMREMDEITKCPRCGCYDRVSQLKERASFWKRPKYLKELTASEYLDALQKGVATSKKDEIFLRVRAWWAANDRYRNRRPVADVVLPAAATENLIKLSGLLDDSDPDHVLTKAEIARELGRMDEADRILAQSLPPKYDYVVTHFREWIQAGERRVKWIKWDDADDLFKGGEADQLRRGAM